MEDINLELLNNIKVEQNIDIEDLFIPENKRSTVIKVKEEPGLENESIIDTSIHDGDMKSEALKLEMKREITELFKEFDMMCLNEYDQSRIEKVQTLFERYLTDQTNLSVQLLEYQLKDKTNEMAILKNALEISNSANLELRQKCKCNANESFKLEEKFENSQSDNFKLQQNIQEYKNSKDKLFVQTQSLKTEVVCNRDDQKVATSTSSNDAPNGKRKAHCKNKNKKALKQHLCSICDSSFTRSTGLKKHVEAIHENKKDTCKFCGNKFRKYKLKEHISVVHEGIKPHKCKLCQLSFGRKWDLRTHNEMHQTQNKEYMI